MKVLKVMIVGIAILIGAMVLKNNVTPLGLGLDQGRLKALAFTPNGVSSQTEDDRKFVQPLDFQMNLETSKAYIKLACEAYGKAQLKTETQTYLHYVFKTETMGFKDDVEFYFDVDHQVIHYRSQSRLGYSDMGLNRARYEELSDFYTNYK